MRTGFSFAFGKLGIFCTFKVRDEYLLLHGKFPVRLDTQYLNSWELNVKKEIRESVQQNSAEIGLKICQNQALENPRTSLLQSLFTGLGGGSGRENFYNVSASAV